MMYDHNIAACNKLQDGFRKVYDAIGILVQCRLYTGKEYELMRDAVNKLDGVIVDLYFIADIVRDRTEVKSAV